VVNIGITRCRRPRMEPSVPFSECWYNVQNRKCEESAKQLQHYFASSQKQPGQTNSCPGRQPRTVTKMSLEYAEIWC